MYWAKLGTRNMNRVSVLMKSCWAWLLTYLCLQVLQVRVGVELIIMGAGLQVVGMLVGVVSWCLQSSSTSSQVWRTRSQLESVSSSQWQFEGLWMSCAATSLGSVQCSRFKTLLGLPGETHQLLTCSWERTECFCGRGLTKRMLWGDFCETWS